MITARERRAAAKKLAHVRDGLEITSNKDATIRMICADGHPELRSFTRYSAQGRVTSVLWVCTHEGCTRKFEVDPKKLREAERAKWYAPSEEKT